MGSFRRLRRRSTHEGEAACRQPWPAPSYQSHEHRGEHWVVVKGTATVTINDRTRRYGYGKHVNIPRGAKHRLANLGEEVLEVIEVQIGDYFGADDIKRYQDDHGRITGA